MTSGATEITFTYFSDLNGFDGIPAYMHDAIRNYVDHGWLPGGFLTAVLANDLFDAVAHADSANRFCLPAWVEFITNHCPAACHGSFERVNKWVNAGGFHGLMVSEDEEWMEVEDGQ